METDLPDLGKATSIYIREVTTIDEDFHYLFGYAFIGLFTELSETPGVTKELMVSHIIENHAPNSEQDLANFSLSIYVR